MSILKHVILAIMLLVPSISYAVNISVDSSIRILNAPSNSVWQVECGGSTGVYNSFTRQFTMQSGINTIPVSSIFLTSGTFFCRTAFVQTYGISPYSTEVSVTVVLPTLSAPSLSVIP